MFGVLPITPLSADSYLFTTIFFLDYGQNYSNDPFTDGYVYVYGLNNDFRDQTQVYLAKVPSTSILNRSTWLFYTGMSGNTPTWSSDITQEEPVLTDNVALYQTMFGTDCPANQLNIAQGGVTYDKPLQRYIMVTWGCATMHYYEAPQPWGPWSVFYVFDHGPLELTTNRGQYGTSIPSKYISADGLTLYEQSNVCCSGDSYTFSLRKVYLQTYTPASPTNSLSTTNLALASGTRAISKSTHYGSLCGLNCSDQISNGPPGNSEDDYDEESKTVDWWGYTWPQPYNINQVTYTTGIMFTDGSWYANSLRVQVRQNFQWIDVTGAAVTPTYPYSNQAGSMITYSFTFPDTWGDGVRITGAPGGTHNFTSISQLGVYYAASPVGNPDFGLSINTGSISLVPGNSGGATINVIPEFGFNQQISFACSGLPSESFCNFSPSTVTPNGSATNVAMIITTTAPSAAGKTDPWPFVGGGSMLALCLLYPRRRKCLSFWVRLGLMMALLVVVCGMATSCGGGGNSTTSTNLGTPAGTSTVTITATSGSGSSTITNSTTLSLVVL
jgi:hypothetical protein